MLAYLREKLEFCVKTSSKYISFMISQWKTWTWITKIAISQEVFVYAELMVPYTRIYQRKIYRYHQEIKFTAGEGLSKKKKNISFKVI